jgi:hypothetical protein
VRWQLCGGFHHRVLGILQQHISTKGQTITQCPVAVLKAIGWGSKRHTSPHTGMQGKCRGNWLVTMNRPPDYLQAWQTPKRKRLQKQLALVIPIALDLGSPTNRLKPVHGRPVHLRCWQHVRHRTLKMHIDFSTSPDTQRLY